MRVSRNAPCPCGSGKKNKHCCGPTAGTAQDDLLAGVAHHQAGRLADAEAAYRRLLDAPAVRQHALHYLGMIRFQLGLYAEARTLIERALTIEQNPAFLSNLGNACQRLGDHAAAEDAYRTANKLAPDNPDILLNLGGFLASHGKREEALALYLGAGDAATQHPRLCLEQAQAALETGNYDKALSLCRQALEVHGPQRELLLLEARLLFLIGDSDSAMDGYASVGIASDKEACSAWLFARSTRTWPPAECLRDHADWSRRFLPPPASPPQPGLHDTSDAGRRLRIGYLSSDFRRHAMRFFARPLLAGHDRERFDVHAFHCGRTDDTTRELSLLPEHWHAVGDLDDAALAEYVARCEIDFLVDLSGHTSGNRLGTLNLMPAPRQASMLGYLPTLGMNAVRYRISDRIALPAALRPGYSEECLLLEAHSQWCYRPDSDTPEVSVSPGGAACRFGSFHNAAKVDNGVLEAWRQILARRRDASLTLVSWSEGERKYMQDRLQRHGVPLDQVIFRAPAFGTAYWKLFGEVDIFLDVFPYNGGTVSLDALWMGVPVVSCASEHPAGYGGASILARFGQSDWCGNTPEEFAAIALTLAENPPKDVARRLAVREQLAASPLMDECGFMRELEALISGVCKV